MTFPCKQHTPQDCQQDVLPRLCRHASIACMFKRKDCCAKEVKTSAFTIASHASTSAVVLRKSILTASVLVTATPCMFASMQARSCKVQTRRNTSCTMTRHSLSRKMSCHDTVHVTSEDACCLRSTRVAEDMVACVFQRSSSRVAKACWMANTPPRSARRRSPAPPPHPPAAWLAATAQRHEQARQRPAPTAPAAQRWTAAAEAYTRGGERGCRAYRRHGEHVTAGARSCTGAGNNPCELGRHPCCVRAKPANYGHRGARCRCLA